MRLFELQSPVEVIELERQLDSLMRPVGLDVEFSRHFVERLLGRERKVTTDEIVAAFNKLKKKYKKRLLSAKRQNNFKALLRDLSAELNIAFAIKGDELHNITLMRKANFGNDNYDSIELNV